MRMSKQVEETIYSLGNNQSCGAIASGKQGKTAPGVKVNDTPSEARLAEDQRESEAVAHGIHNSEQQDVSATSFSSARSFPCKLMEMINWCEQELQANEKAERTVCWAHNGKAITIYNQEKLCKRVLPVFFKDCKFESFLRRLYRWGFKQLSPTEESCDKGLTLFVDGFERDDPTNCWTKLAVRYSDNERDARKKKSMKAKLKKMKKNSMHLAKYKSQKAERPLKQEEKDPPDYRLNNHHCHKLTSMDVVTESCATATSSVPLLGCNVAHSNHSVPCDRAEFTNLLAIRHLGRLRERGGVSLCCPPVSQPGGVLVPSRQLISQESLMASTSTRLSRILKLQELEQSIAALRNVRELNERGRMFPPLRPSSSTAASSSFVPYYPMQPAGQARLPELEALYMCLLSQGHGISAQRVADLLGAREDGDDPINQNL
jgi:hypothetical protein